MKQLTVLLIVALLSFVSVLATADPVVVATDNVVLEVTGMT